MRFNTQPPEGGWDNPSLGCQFGVLFQHTAARRRLASADYLSDGQQQFQHTAARRRLASSAVTSSASKPFQHTAARRRLEAVLIQPYIVLTVSPHSRPKAAGRDGHHEQRRRLGFNTQPPEGGWRHRRDSARTRDRFNTQPPEGGWFIFPELGKDKLLFQHTAARRRLEPLSKALLHQVSQPRFR